MPVSLTRFIALDRTPFRSVERVLDKVEQSFRHRRGRQHQVDDSGFNRVSRHPVELGGVFTLNDHESSGFMDRPNAVGAVAASAGKNDAYRSLAEILREGSKEFVDRQTQTCAGSLSVSSRRPPEMIISFFGGMR